MQLHLPTPSRLKVGSLSHRHHLSHLRLPASTKKVARPTAPSYHRRPQIDGLTSHCVSRPVRLVIINTTLPRWAQCYRTQCALGYIPWHCGVISYQQSNPSLISPSWLGLDFLKPSECTSERENKTEPVTRNLLHLATRSDAEI